ncbi:hypothetical protein KKH43_02615 [Patescibacteria group bacterium]|nr:hypothetical protein [Patescibacteria group bacterium]
MKQIIPAILTDDISVLKERIKAVEGVAEWVQIDIMDNTFVPYKTVSVLDLVTIKTTLKLEIHLMVSDPIKYLDDCHEAKAQRVIFHREAVLSPKHVLEAMDDYFFDTGVALNPESSAGDLVEHHASFEMLLLLGVTPGKSGQKFILGTIDKIKEVRSLFPHTEISVDGGVDETNIKAITDAGADSVSIGSGLYRASDVHKQYKKLVSLVKKTKKA